MIWCTTVATARESSVENASHSPGGVIPGTVQIGTRHSAQVVKSYHSASEMIVKLPVANCVLINVWTSTAMYAEVDTVVGALNGNQEDTISLVHARTVRGIFAPPVLVGLTAATPGVGVMEGCAMTVFPQDGNVCGVILMRLVLILKLLMVTMVKNVSIATARAQPVVAIAATKS